MLNYARKRETGFDKCWVCRKEIDQARKYLALHQVDYATKLEALLITATLGDFRSTKAKLAWIVNIRPDVCYIAS